MKLTIENVHNTFEKCLSQNQENLSEPIIVEFMKEVAFDSTILNIEKDNIISMLNSLSNRFKKSGDGGDSFLTLCLDNTGEMWTGSQRTVAQLVLLGLAIKKVNFPLHKEFWPVLPGGMPIVQIDL